MAESTEHSDDERQSSASKLDGGSNEHIQWLSVDASILALLEHRLEQNLGPFGHFEALNPLITRDVLRSVMGSICESQGLPLDSQRSILRQCFIYSTSHPKTRFSRQNRSCT